MGGASGPLFGTLFFRMGGSLGELSQTTPDLFGKALRAGLEGVVSRGRAEPGDKTMFDALSPGVTAFEGAVSHGAALGPAAARASAAAAAGRDATAPMVARKGRASYLGERSVGHVDPGAASVALLFEAATLAF
jgi:dihydroxyacetone kinase-like protein